MSEKSVQKKQMILERARGVFATKGYTSVTMKDIVDACDISRGGLYLYFENTRDIFLEVLKKDYEEDDTFDRSISEDSTPSDILAIFFREQKRAILSRKNSLVVACYEFFFTYDGDRKDNLLRSQFEGGVFVLEKLLEKGTQMGELYCENCKTTAHNIMYLLEGLKVSARIYGVTEKAVDDQLLYIMKSILPAA